MTRTGCRWAVPAFILGAVGGCCTLNLPGLSNDTISGCGTLVSGVEAGCVLFMPDSGGTNYLVTSAQLGGFTAGQHVRIVGTKQSNAPSICQQGTPLSITSIASCP